MRSKYPFLVALTIRPTTTHALLNQSPWTEYPINSAAKARLFDTTKVTGQGRLAQPKVARPVRGPLSVKQFPPTDPWFLEFDFFIFWFLGIHLLGIAVPARRFEGFPLPLVWGTVGTNLEPTKTESQWILASTSTTTAEECVLGRAATRWRRLRLLSSTIHCTTASGHELHDDFFCMP